MLRALKDRRAETRARWEALLRIERVNTPLANPDALVHLFDWTMEDVFSKLEGRPSGEIVPDPAGSAGAPHACRCGRNPYVAYFKAAKQALTEALVLAQTEMPLLGSLDRDMAMVELLAVVDALAYSEQTAFCALCTHSAKPQHASAMP